MENTPKSQVVERLREAQNVLVTVSTNPSVDQLSAAIGFTLLMNKLGKHATAVFSGQIPSTLEFLKPAETLEPNTDSLRDFIIALDKSKADKLRYKVEEDVVRIFITPYRTSLSEADLNFSQGDFNVDVVVALGVDEQTHIDQAITSHGRILHDATVIGVAAGQQNTDVGTVNWKDENASSLCEMLVSISEAFQSNLLDGQMATAFLTGIVAETDRFSNQKTSPKVMTMSAQLMAAGANQQLIATELQQAGGSYMDSLPAPVGDDQETSIDINHGEENNDNFAPTEPHEELAQAINEVQARSEEANDRSREKVIEPLQEDTGEQSNLSPYMTEPPEHTGTLTANTVPEQYDPSTDPLSVIPDSSFTLNQEDKTRVEPLVDDTSTSSPLLSVQDDAESVQASEIPSTPDVMLPDDGVSDDVKPLGPEVEPSDTLEDIEHAVEEYSGEQPHNQEQADQAVSADDARQAVMDAVTSAGGGFDPNRPEPLQSINAQEFPDTELPANEINQVDAPPTVPPPLMPPFPIPGAEVYEPPEEDLKIPPSAPPVA